MCTYQDVYFSDGHLEGFAPSFGALLADTSVDPALIEHWASQTYLFHLRTQHLHQIYWENCHLPIIDEPFISVDCSDLSRGEGRRLLFGSLKTESFTGDLNDSGLIDEKDSGALQLTDKGTLVLRHIGALDIEL